MRRKFTLVIHGPLTLLLLDLIATVMAENVSQSPMEVKGLSKYLSFTFHRSVERALWTFCELGVADLMVHHQYSVSAVERNDGNLNKTDHP